MITYKNLNFDEFKEEDIEILTPIMTRAFDEDSRIHLNEPKGGPEGYNTGVFLRKYGLDRKSDAYKISSQEGVIGGLIVWINKVTGINYLGCIFLDVTCQNKGYGKRVWDFVEQRYPDTKKWCTETPAFSRRNHNFYINKCGFHVVRIENPKDRKEASFKMEKVMR
ncbi:GNAT family N-acetyltransferase [Mobilitalea sibirica]|uniref:GNAT family N-acetyltransferase n=1 Tax=Mobilitalea sibirica TaxID=1462919 RepID=A0A8J7H643_9FIRM|nr:GNAT family N-acetyltransferase [Mobilitalea sibirica]MBH1942134.1 GNAT family N-acetyltransferase [Mobilitalea sibirica]